MSTIDPEKAQKILVNYMRARRVLRTVKRAKEFKRHAEAEIYRIEKGADMVFDSADVAQDFVDNGIHPDDVKTIIYQKLITPIQERSPVLAFRSFEFLQRKLRK